MSYEKTKLFSEGIESNDPEVRKAAIADREQMFNEFRDAGVANKDIEELDFWEYNKETHELYFDRIGREFALTIEKRLPRVVRSVITFKEDTDFEKEICKFKDSVTSIKIEEFTGNFEELLTMLDNFYNLKEARISNMLSLGVIEVKSNHRLNYEVTVNKCSAYKLGDELENSNLAYPKIRVNQSLMEEVGVYGNFVVKSGMEEWSESLIVWNHEEFQKEIELECFRRFNSVTIFNKLYGTKLRSLKGMDYELKVTPGLRQTSLEGIVETTKFGYKILKNESFCMSFGVGIGQYNTDFHGVVFKIVPYEED